MLLISHCCVAYNIMLCCLSCYDSTALELHDNQQTAVSLLHGNILHFITYNEVISKLIVLSVMKPADK